MFSAYFALHYFARRYFPHPAVVVSPTPTGYFPHGYFSQRFYPDRYFPGPLISVVEPPTPPVQHGAGGGPVPIFLPVIHAVADLVLPALEFQAFGFVTPATLHARADLQLLADLVIRGELQAHPAQIETVAALLLEDLVFSGELHAAPPGRRRRVRTDEDEEQLLQDHYLWTLASIKTE